MNANDPAFPVTPDTFGDPPRAGLTKREILAAMAMQGMLANQCVFDDGTSSALRGVAQWSVDAAEALIAELNKTNPQ